MIHPVYIQWYSLDYRISEQMYNMGYISFYYFTLYGKRYVIVLLYTVTCVPPSVIRLLFQLNIICNWTIIEFFRIVETRFKTVRNLVVKDLRFISIISNCFHIINGYLDIDFEQVFFGTNYINILLYVYPHYRNYIVCYES